MENLTFISQILSQSLRNLCNKMLYKSNIALNRLDILNIRTLAHMVVLKYPNQF